MSGIDDLYRQATSGLTGMSPDLEAFASEFPNVWAIFVGTPPAPDNPGRPPATVLIFAEGGRLKFCIKPKWGGHVAFGTVADASQGLLGVDNAIRDGQLEWKASKVRK